MRNEASGADLPEFWSWFISAEPENLKREESTGRAGLMLTVEPTPPDCRRAVDDLYTSTPETSSDARVSNEKDRPLAWLGSVDEAIWRPLTKTVLNSGPNPRTVMNSPSPPERSMETPVMRWSDSARLVSGNLPISSR